MALNMNQVPALLSGTAGLGAREADLARQLAVHNAAYAACRKKNPGVKGTYRTAQDPCWGPLSSYRKVDAELERARSGDTPEWVPYVVIGGLVLVLAGGLFLRRRAKRRR